VTIPFFLKRIQSHAVQKKIHAAGTGRRPPAHSMQEQIYAQENPLLLFPICQFMKNAFSA
jgi:hypothetical protein